jgi:hypothetical protein
MTSLNYGWYPSYDFLTAEAFGIYVFLSVVIETFFLAAFFQLKKDQKISDVPMWFFFLTVSVANIISGFIGYFMAIKGF